MDLMFVFVTQLATKRDGSRRVPKFDLTPAQKYGEIEVLLSDTAAPWKMDENILPELHEKLEGYSDADYIIPMGNLAIASAAVAVAAHYNNGRVNLLQWHGRLGEYTPILIRDLFRTRS